MPHFETLTRPLAQPQGALGAGQAAAINLAARMRAMWRQGRPGTGGK